MTWCRKQLQFSSLCKL